MERWIFGNRRGAVVPAIQFTLVALLRRRESLGVLLCSIFRHEMAIFAGKNVLFGHVWWVLAQVAQVGVWGKRHGRKWHEGKSLCQCKNGGHLGQVGPSGQGVSQVEATPAAYTNRLASAGPPTCALSLFLVVFYLKDANVGPRMPTRWPPSKLAFE
jgi:hypothetical protein